MHTEKSTSPNESCRFFGSPCWARTSDTLINSQVLVPTELRRNMGGEGWEGVTARGRGRNARKRSFRRTDATGEPM